MNEKILCPYCGSDQLTANKKGFSGRKSLIGGLLVGPIGLLGGTLSSNKVKITCLNCGKEFKPGQGAHSEQEVAKKQEQSSNGKVIAFIIVCFMLLVGYLIRTCNGSENESKSNTSTENPVKINTPEFIAMQQDFTKFELRFNKIYDSIINITRIFDEKWLGQEVHTTKNFNIDVENVKKACKAAVEEYNALPNPNISQFTGIEMESFFDGPKGKMVNGFLVLENYYNNFQNAFYSTDLDLKAFAESAKRSKEASANFFQKGFDELNEAHELIMN